MKSVTFALIPSYTSMNWVSSVDFVPCAPLRYGVWVKSPFPRHITADTWEQDSGRKERKRGETAAERRKRESRGRTR